MKVTTRDWFNYENPPLRYQTFLIRFKVADGDLDPEHTDYDTVRSHKQQGTLAGEQVQHNRSDDEVDCGD